MHKDLTEQINRVRRVINGESCVSVYGQGWLAFLSHKQDLKEIAHAAIERLDKEKTESGK